MLNFVSLAKNALSNGIFSNTKSQIYWRCAIYFMFLPFEPLVELQVQIDAWYSIAAANSEYMWLNFPYGFSFGKHQRGHFLKTHC